MLEASEAFAAKLNKSDLESLRSRLTALTCRFSQHLATQGRACLAQIWVPDAEHDGSVTLHTQVRRYRPVSDVSCFAHTPWLGVPRTDHKL